MSKGIISYDFGHMEGGEDTSANGILYEYSVVRQYGTVVVRELQKAGYTLVNCTPSNGSMSLGQSLSYRVNKANTSGGMLHLCFHANCFNGSAYGCEMEVASDSSERVAQFIQNEVVSLGFANRGVKRPNLYVTRNTNMRCILLEPFFIDNRNDCNKYNVEKLGCAIAAGVLKALGNTYIPSVSNGNKQTLKPVQAQSKKTWELNIQGDIIRRLQRELNRQFGAGLKEDGYAGDATMQKLILVRPGATGNITKIIQELLIRKGYSVAYGADGIFGNGTKQAVMALQRKNGLSVDGIIGQNTWKALIRA